MPQELEDRFVRSMLELVPARIAALEPSAPLYCVVLAYDMETSDPFPPTLGVGLDSERARWSAENPQRLKHRLWNPAEFEFFDIPELDFADVSLLETCALLNERPRRDGASSVPDLLSRTAEALARLDWSGIRLVTPDFIVFATDLEGGDATRNIARSAPATVLAELRRKRWI